MFELRYVADADGFWQLQFRTRQPVVDASGAFCGFGLWSDWSAVPVIHGEHKSIVDVYDTRDGKAGE